MNFELKYSHYHIEYIRTIIFAALGMDSLFYVFALKSLDQSIFKINIFNNRYLIFAIAIGLMLILSAVYLHQLNVVLQTVPLLPIHLLLVACIGVGKLFLIELVKLVHRKNIFKTQAA